MRWRVVDPLRGEHRHDRAVLILMLDGHTAQIAPVENSPGRSPLTDYPKALRENRAMHAKRVSADLLAFTELTSPCVAAYTLRACTAKEIRPWDT